MVYQPPVVIDSVVVIRSMKSGVGESYVEDRCYGEEKREYESRASRNVKDPGVKVDASRI